MTETKGLSRSPGMRFTALGAVLAALAVAADAFGAHVLARRLAPADLVVYEAGARYQMYHALALILVGLLLFRRPSSSLRTAGWLFLIGVVLFSGSLYALAFTREHAFGAITPLGGAAFLAGWLGVAVGSLRKTEG